MPGEKKLEKLRNAIDAIDDQLLKLLNERAQHTLDVGALKREQKRTVFVPAREKEIYERLDATNPGPLPSEAIRHIFREIMSASKALQKGIKVAYLGPQATYTHQAALQQFGHMADYLATQTIAEIFDAVERQRADYGVVPIENSNEGVVSNTLDLFVDSPLTIYAETYVPVAHSLLSQSGDLAAVKIVCSHPQALAQCRSWLELNLPQANLVPTHSTAEAAQRAAEQTEVAAIASPAAAELYGLQTIRPAIQDNASNATRFLVISRDPPKRGEQDTTSILFSIRRDQAGALFQALRPFAENGVNLTRIESRPTKIRAWEYVFFCDFEGHVEEEAVARAISQLRPTCDFVKTLGSFPRALCYSE